MTTHKVQQGECLFSIAKNFGFRDWVSIYGNPCNETLKAKRPDPSILHPGDKVEIPQKATKSEPAAS